MVRVYTGEIFCEARWHKEEGSDVEVVYQFTNRPKVQAFRIDKGIMGVPITYLDKHNPDDFEILGIFTVAKNGDVFLAKPVVNSKEKFARIAIRKKTASKK